MTNDARAKRLRRLALALRLGEVAVRRAAEAHAEAAAMLRDAQAQYAALDQAFASASRQLKEARAALRGRVAKSGSTPGLDLSALETLQAAWLAARDACRTLTQRRLSAARALKEAAILCEERRANLETQSCRLKRIRERADSPRP